MGYPSLRIGIGEKELVFPPTRLVTVGRAAGTDVLIDDPAVSREHGEFRPESGGWHYVDVGSVSGSFVGAEKVARVTIIGSLTLRLGGTDVTATAVAPARTPASVHQAGTLRIGRAPDNDIAIADVQVSHYHAELRGREIVDLGSRNGTYVDGRRVRTATVDERSIIAIGSHTFRLDGDRLEEYVDEGEITFDAFELTFTLAGGRTILHSVSFPVDPSSLVAILGPTGAGKSTLAKALTGFQPATSGTVLYNRRDLYAAYDELRRRIGYVPQEDILHPQLTIARALDYGAQLRFPPDVSAAERRARVAEVMAELGLTDHRNTPIANLSGGQRKRTSVAMELLSKPSLLFLDEPTSGLDPGYEKSVMQLLRDLADAGRSVLVITHSVQSLDLCDSLLFLAKGGFTAFFGPPTEALSYFGSSDYPGVFNQLETRPGAEAQEQFAAHQSHEAYVRVPLSNRPEVPAAKGDVRLSVTGIRPRSELLVLIRRYLSVIAADKRNLRLLIAQAPLIALLVWALAPADALAPLGAPGTPRGARNSASTVLLALTLGAAFMGLSNSIREIVKELPIYRRERAVGVSVWAYLGSKAVVLGVITVLQAALLVVIGTWKQTQFTDGVTPFGPVKVELFLAVALTGIAAMALGLMLSALVTTADKALTLLPVVLLGLFLLAGPLFNLTDRPGMRELSYVTATRWGFSALASTTDLEGIRGCKPADCQSSWNHTVGTWLANMAALAVLTTLSLFIASAALRRRDPLRSWKRARGRAARQGPAPPRARPRPDGGT